MRGLLAPRTHLALRLMSVTVTRYCQSNCPSLPHLVRDILQTGKAYRAHCSLSPGMKMKLFVNIILREIVWYTMTCRLVAKVAK